ncbi:putative RNA binding protein rbp16 [Diplonema papillatum]|nr:putative RNA binding protein rbp16 [Diplonema papillatum]
MPRETGIVAKWLHHRGYGFIRPLSFFLRRAVFVHHKEIRTTGHRTLAVDAEVEFDLAWSEGQPYARNVTGRAGAVPPCTLDVPHQDLTGKIDL